MFGDTVAPSALKLRDVIDLVRWYRMSSIRILPTQRMMSRFECRRRLASVQGYRSPATEFRHGGIRGEYEIVQAAIAEPLNDSAHRPAVSTHGPVTLGSEPVLPASLSFYPGQGGATHTQESPRDERTAARVEASQGVRRVPAGIEVCCVKASPASTAPLSVSISFR